ncbi:MAG TPA: hypothetical protein VN278_04750 [Methanosarcina sp.]|nr:hypothetical protein [Methanosarcina sp.]
MRYTFQDSTDFPVQRDFIQDLQNFIAISKEVIPLEKSATEIKKANIKQREFFERRLQEIDCFEKDIRDYIESRTFGIKAADILEIKRSTLETLSGAAFAKREEKLEELDKQNKLDSMEVQQLETRILSTLSPFFEEGIYGAKNAYYAFIDDKILKGRQISFVDRLQYEFELIFIQNTLKVKDFQDLALPIRLKNKAPSKEEKVENIDVSEFYITSIEYNGEILRAALEDKNAENRFMISADEKNFLIIHMDYEITGDEELAALINRESVNTFIKKLKEIFTEAVGSKILKKIVLDGKNAIEENKIFDCLKVIASIYGKLVTVCIEKRYTEGEIAIKAEGSEGIKTEKYLGKSDVLKDLSALGDEGAELAAILGFNETCE